MQCSSSAIWRSIRVDSLDSPLVPKEKLAMAVSKRLTSDFEFKGFPFRLSIVRPERFGCYAMVEL